MFEERLKEISQELGGEKRVFYILTNKKNKREIYFQNNRESINFMEFKFLSFFKRIVFNLIKFKSLQPFLNKTTLSEKLGGVIFVGGQIKSFDLSKKHVFSFIKNENSEQKKEFIIIKEFQNKIAKRGFAPKIIEINKKIPFSKEELLKNWVGETQTVFEKIIKFYFEEKIKKISTKKYLQKLEKKIGRNFLFQEFLKNSKNFPKKILVSTNHGRFSKEQILEKKGFPAFTDWQPKTVPITSDFSDFFRYKKENKNNEFKRVLELYPSEVKKNILFYLILNEFEFISLKRKINYEYSLKKIKSLMKKLNAKSFNNYAKDFYNV